MPALIYYGRMVIQDEKGWVAVVWLGAGIALVVDAIFAWGTFAGPVNMYMINLKIGKGF